MAEKTQVQQTPTPTPEQEPKPKKKHYRLWLIICYVCSFIATILPLCIVFCFRWDNYVKTPADAVKLSFGGVIVAFFMLLKVLGKFHMPKRIFVYAVVILLCYLFEPLMDDIMLLAAMALLGEAIDYFIFQTLIRKIKEAMNNQKIADTTASEVEGILKKYLGNIQQPTGSGGNGRV